MNFAHDFINNKDKVGSSIILLFALAYLNSTFNIPVSQLVYNEVFTARTLPIALSIMTIVVCLIQLFTPTRDTVDETIADAIADFHWRPCLLLTGLMFIYGLSFSFLGFIAATFIFLFIGFSIMGERRFPLSLLVSASVVAFMWIILTQVFDVFLDSGNLYRLLVER